SQLVEDSRNSKLTYKTAETESRCDESHLLRRQLQIVREIDRQHASENEDARHCADQPKHAEHDISVLQHVRVAGVASRTHRADGGSALCISWLPSNEKQECSDNESRNGDHPEHCPPRCKLKKLCRDDRAEAETEQGKAAPLHTLNKSTT